MDWITLDSVIFAPVTLYLENWINIVMLLLLETDDEIGPTTFCKLLQKFYSECTTTSLLETSFKSFNVKL